MPAAFHVGEIVKVNTPIPEGPVLQIGVDQQGNINYLVEFIEYDQTQQRWFNEDQLIAVT
ncbi:MAG: hypothetical protein EBS91_11395 [Betaproteobacteria bacterium]|jgi:hypothetical protein|nr:hypothetical protein [Bacteroidota bacterium]NCA25170.1 hypothetical protein [Betaproteobacteria bacterium]